MTDNETVSQWLDQLKHGNDQAVQELWDRYQFRQMGLARKLLGDAPRGAADEEDVALSAFNSFCIRAAEGKFPCWRIVTICGRFWRRSRSARQADWPDASAVAREPTSGRPMEDFSDDGPSPEFAAISKQEMRRLFDLLDDDQLRLVAYCKLEGETNAQIARDDRQVCANRRTKAQDDTSIVERRSVTMNELSKTEPPPQSKSCSSAQGKAL